MQLVRVVDVDLAFLLFLAVDWLWLWATGRLAGAPGRPWRIWLAAALGAVLGVWGEFPSGAWMHTWPAKLGLSLLMLAAAFGGQNPPRALPRLLLFFFGTGAGMAGAALLLSGGHQRGFVLVPAAGGVWTGYVGPAAGAEPLVLLGIAIAVVGGHTLLQAARAWRRLAAGLVEVEAWLQGRHARLTGLVDTGNQLREPVSGLPALVVSAAEAGGLMPAELLQAARQTDSEPLPDRWAARCRLVPYRSVGARGWLLAVRPDQLRVAGVPATAYLAISPSPVDPSGRFQVLVPAALTAGGGAGDPSIEAMGAGGEDT